MKKKAVVKQKHLYSEQTNTIYNGVINFKKEDSRITLEYQEDDDYTQVKIYADEKELQIRRDGEIHSQLLYKPFALTKGTILTDFGTIEISIYTHKYIKKDNVIVVEYDILQNNDVIEGYRIIWNLKEDTE